MPRRYLPLLALLSAVFVLLLGACSGGGDGDDAGSSSVTPVPTPAPIDDFVVGKPLVRNGIGDVDAVFARYGATRAELIDLYRLQAWFKDGLTREESLFVERGISFVAKYDGPRSATIGEETIRRKLYRYDKLQLSSGEVELILIYEPGDNAERELNTIKQILPVLEQVIGVPYPEKVMTFVNGDFGINDFNEGEFIRIDDCCTISSFILAHELSHTYWTVGPSWFNEGMADLFAVMIIERLNQGIPEGWKGESRELASYYAQRKQAAARFPAKTLTARLTEEGLYEAADVFLYEIREILGAEDFLAAAKRAYLTSDYARMNLSDFRIEEVFLQFAEGDQQEQIKQLFNKMIWGDNGQKYEAFKEREANP
ncbi:MAG: hypothetical protein AB7P33_15535 [Dehalococcoidia bacterium]